ncbi:unnamed protein product [Tenebrio molitor]|nr:unnamed protein product [Tenebrio molitor]
MPRRRCTKTVRAVVVGVFILLFCGSIFSYTTVPPGNDTPSQIIKYLDFRQHSKLLFTIMAVIILTLFVGVIYCCIDNNRRRHTTRDYENQEREILTRNHDSLPYL